MAALAGLALLAGIAVVPVALPHEPSAPVRLTPDEPSWSSRPDPASPEHHHARVHYDWPLHPEPEVLRPFEPPDQVWSPGHRGVDLRAALGEPVRAAADGVVAFAGRVVDRVVVSIDHADGVRTTYEPLDAAVRAGDRVTQGQVIGYVAAHDDGPHCPGGCLHWGARIGSDLYLDPLTLLGLADVVVRLYPSSGRGAVQW